ncbi:alkylglycerol monooxygenase-like [Homarus americanus]|nr:alkylglycerol monooxygenase-like [Homarus americanus]
MMEWTLLQRVGTMFYLVSPNSTSFSRIDHVPNYIHEAIPVMAVFMLVDLAVRFLQGKTVRFSEVFFSVNSGILDEAARLSWVVLLGYQWLYQYRIWDLPWDSLYTWFGAFILVDLCYYWIHRANHEVNILWAVHQYHHSAEDFTFSTSIRNSVLQRAIHFGFYHPLALIGFPLPTVAVHIAFNYLYQFFMHNEYVGNLGPIGWVLMTPSLHRVHHGSNKWCLDKNYASVFVIWDRIFGTFEPERDNEVIVYGLTEQPQTHNVLWHQVYYFDEIYKKARSMSTWRDSLKAVFYGPGWSPGAPRLGDPDTFPDVKAPRAKYDPQLPLWQVVYVVSHQLLALSAQQLMVIRYTTSSWLMVLTFLVFITMAVCVTSAIFDGWRWAPMAEAARCGAFAYAFTTPVTAIPDVDTALMVYFSLCFLFWTKHGLNHPSAKIHTNKKN